MRSHSLSATSTGALWFFLVLDMWGNAVQQFIKLGDWHLRVLSFFNFQLYFVAKGQLVLQQGIIQKTNIKMYIYIELNKAGGE